MQGGPMCGRILYIDIALQTREFCMGLIKHFTPEMICAGDFGDEDKSTCAGDSGDPFMLDDTVYGIATYGLGCGNASMPSVYTSVYYHMDWIKHVMKVNGSRRCLNIVWVYFILSCLWTLFA